MDEIVNNEKKPLNPPVLRRFRAIANMVNMLDHVVIGKFMELKRLLFPAPIHTAKEIS